MIRIRFHGRGGHGTKTASRIVGTAAFLGGYQAQDSPVYGAERRGAAVVAFTRIDADAILERGVIEQPDLIILADETLLDTPDANVLANQESASAIFINSPTAERLQEQYDISPPVVALDVTTLTLETLGSASALSAALAAAAARMSGVIEHRQLVSAMREEFSNLHVASELIEKNVVVADRVFAQVEPVEIRRGEQGHAEKRLKIEMAEVRADNPLLSTPSVLHAGNAVARQTGSWRVERPVIDPDICTRCGLCFVRCPDGAISLDEEGYPVIDYDHCKGCMICRADLSASGHRVSKGDAGMVRKLLTGNAAAAWGARLAEVDYVPAFPITPQTEIIETLGEWFDAGEMTGKFVTLDSEHSMITAAGAAAATGVRTFTATSSQGLVYAMEALYTVSGWRVPFVLVNVSRGLSAPITLGPDHNDVLAARDTGFVQLHAETCQEVLDTVLMAYRIAEDARVSLPVLVNLDGFYLSFTREPVEIPDVEQVREFLPPFRPKHPVFRASQPVAQGVAVLEGSTYSYFRYQMHRAVENALEVHAEAAQDFERIFGRRYETLDAYRLDDAETVIVMAGSFATKGKEAVNRWREQGKHVGLLRPRMIRPQPVDDLVNALSGRAAVGVIDQNLSPGLGGILYHELAAVLVNCDERPRGAEIVYRWTWRQGHQPRRT